MLEIFGHQNPKLKTKRRKFDPMKPKTYYDPSQVSSNMMLNSIFGGASPMAALAGPAVDPTAPNIDQIMGGSIRPQGPSIEQQFNPMSMFGGGALSKGMTLNSSPFGRR